MHLLNPRYVGRFHEKDEESALLKQEIQVLLNKQAHMTKLQFSHNDQQTEIKLLKKVPFCTLTFARKSTGWLSRF